MHQNFNLNGGWRAVRGFFALAVYGFSLFMLVVAPYELSLVHAAHNWPAIPAHIASVELVPPPFLDGQDYWEFHMTRDDNGASISTADVRPGDFPFSALGWSTVDADAARYHRGQAITVWVSPDGRHIFLEQGSPWLMSIILASCIVVWLWVALSVRRTLRQARKARLAEFSNLRQP